LYCETDIFNAKMDNMDLFAKDELLAEYVADTPTVEKRPVTKANKALEPQVMTDEAFRSETLRKLAYYADDKTILLNMDVNAGLRLLQEHGVMVNCLVTSPPFYGQRDYGVDGQIGLEEHPRQFIEQLVHVFENAKPLIAENGSVWVNLGDTYWSGKGEHKSGEAKQNARRFGIRPQDKKGDGSWCVPKQLLLIPHRFAIGMQDNGWLVRNDNVWIKPNPVPDQVRDRCSISHEYVFHFVKSRWYFFDKKRVARTADSGSSMPPLDTWQVPTSRGSHAHKARFSTELLRIPILATAPPNGVVLDPFSGSGTTLMFARAEGLRSIGIDLSTEFCETVVNQIRNEQ
jgi:site-specific DNA-methyltransferase (cytosine-N4-specific)